MPTWLAVQRSKAVFFLTLYDSINDMKYFRNCLHHTSSLPQPFLLLIADNLALAGFNVTFAYLSFNVTYCFNPIGKSPDGANPGRMIKIGSCDVTRRRR